jgi:hypothetical protein
VIATERNASAERMADGRRSARTWAAILAILMLAFAAWALIFASGTVHIVVNGQELSGPVKGAVATGGLAIALVAFLCATIFLLFVFAGIGLLIVGGAVALGIIVAALLFPYLLVVLVPLAIVWVFVALTRRPS